MSISQSFVQDILRSYDIKTDTRPVPLTDIVYSINTHSLCLLLPS